MRIEIPLEDILAKVRQHHVGIVIGCGVIARVTEYLRNRGYWLDEGSLAGVIQNTTWGGFFRPLAHGQLAPVGFLALERLALQVLGDRQLVLRLLPLLGGLISLWLLRVIAARSLTPRAALLVVGMFAFSDELIYFSSELKPYSTDVTVALVCLLMGQQYLAAETSSVRRLAILALAPWFSCPSVFMLAGVGLVLFVSAGSKRKLREMLELAGIGTIWIVSTAVAQWVAHRQLGDTRAMFLFWDFAFPARPGNLRTDVVWMSRKLTYLFVNPLDFSVPGLGAKVPAFFALGLALIGCVTMARRDARLLGMLTTPLVLALLAGYSRLYPFHGRLVLFLIPSLMMLVAVGAGRIVERFRSRFIWILMVGFLVLIPGISALYYVVDGSRDREFSTHGDRRSPKLVAESFPF